MRISEISQLIRLFRIFDSAGTEIELTQSPIGRYKGPPEINYRLFTPVIIGFLFAAILHLLRQRMTMREIWR